MVGNEGEGVVAEAEGGEELVAVVVAGYTKVNTAVGPSAEGDHTMAGATSLASSHCTT